MKKYLLSCFLFLVLSVGVQVEYEKAPEVRVTLSSGKKYDGEILSVRDHSIVLSTLHGASEAKLVQSREAIVVLNHDDIREVLLIGDSNVLPGMGIGMGAGCLAGFLIGSSMEVTDKSNDPFGCRGAAEKSNNQWTGGLIGGLGGTLVGAGIGGAIRDNIMVIGLEDRDFSALKLLSRYGSEEPWFLRELGLP